MEPSYVECCGAPHPSIYASNVWWNLIGQESDVIKCLFPACRVYNTPTFLVIVPKLAWMRLFQKMLQHTHTNHISADDDDVEKL